MFDLCFSSLELRRWMWGEEFFNYWHRIPEGCGTLGKRKINVFGCPKGECVHSQSRSCPAVASGCFCTVPAPGGCSASPSPSSRNADEAPKAVTVCLHTTHAQTYTHKIILLWDFKQWNVSFTICFVAALCRNQIVLFINLSIKEVKTKSVYLLL